MGIERRIITIEGGGQWFRPCVRPGRRRGTFIWFENEDVPGLGSGQRAEFEIERECRAGAKWLGVRRVEA